MQALGILPRFDITDFGQSARIGCIIMQRTGRHLIGIAADGRGILSTEPFEHAAVETPPVVKRVTAAQALVEARTYGVEHGLTLVGWHPDTRTATYARPLPAVRALRDRFAGILKTEAHNVQVFVEWSAEEARIERVKVSLPVTSVMEERRASILAELLKAIPGNSSGWTITEDQWSGDVTFTYGVQPMLPSRVALADILPDRLDPEGWAFSAFGKDANGRVTGHDLSRGPHTLLSGPTNSGKTVAINAMLVSRLVRDHDVLIIDPTKALDFPWAEEFALGIAKTYAEARVAIEWVAAEHERRKAVMQAHGAPNWRKLSPEVRAAEGIKSLTVLADELTTLLQPVKVNPNLPKGSPERAAMEAESLAVATIDEGLRKITAVMRASGIFAVLATQKAKGENMGVNGTTLRSNSQNAVYVHPVGTDVEKASVSLLFDSRTDDAVSLAESMDVKNADGSRNPGIAVTMAESGDLTVLRVAFAEPEDIPDLLRSRGVPAAQRNVLGSAAAVAPKAEAEYRPPWADQ